MTKRKDRYGEAKLRHDDTFDMLDALEEFNQHFAEVFEIKPPREVRLAEEQWG